jgi:hypothetical protein
VVLKFLFVRVGELGDNICNRLDHNESHYFERTKVGQQYTLALCIDRVESFEY